MQEYEEGILNLLKIELQKQRPKKPEANEGGGELFPSSIGDFPLADLIGRDSEE